MAVIELGEASAAGVVDPAADRIGPRLDHRRRRTAALLLAVILVLTCGAAARLEPAGLRLLWTAPHSLEDSIVVSDSALYVLAGGSRAELVAYSLADGRRLWRWGTDAHLIGLHPSPDGGPLLVAVDPVSAGYPDGPAALASRTTIALRAESGAELWRRPGEPHRQAVQRDDALLSEFDPRGSTAALTRVRLEDGVPLWRSSGTPVQEIVVERADGRPNRIVTRTAAGDVTVLAWADGARLATRRLPLDGRASTPERYAQLSAANGRLFAIRFSDDEGPDSSVYRLDTLEKLRSGAIADCGGVMCEFVPGGLVMLDPANGHELWRSPEIIASVMTSDRILTNRQDGVEHVLLDSRTGRELSGPVRGWIAQAETWRDEVLLLRPTTEPMGRTAVTRLDLATGRADLLGSLQPMPDQQSCETVPGYLVCTGWDQVVVAGVP